MEQCGSFEWELPNFLQLSERCTSGAFEACSYSWRLICFPKQNVAPWRHISLFLEYPSAREAPQSTPTQFDLIIRNHHNASRNVIRRANFTFTPEQVDWGFSQMLPLTDVSVDSGYLREDGTLCVRVEIGRKPKRQKISHNVGSDLLALLEQPGSTSDITLTAGGRSFQLHRAILAARCDFFKTMFASDFPDGSSRAVPLPDADPDALNLLLRFIYGGVVEECSGQLLKSTMELADRLLLPKACDQLEHWLMDEVGPQTIVEDMLWAERCGRDSLLRDLETAYVQKYAQDVSAADVEMLAEGSPKLMARLHTATVESMKPMAPAHQPARRRRR